LSLQSTGQLKNVLPDEDLGSNIAVVPHHPHDRADHVVISYIHFGAVRRRRSDRANGGGCDHLVSAFSFQLGF